MSAREHNTWDTLPGKVSQTGRPEVMSARIPASAPASAPAGLGHPCHSERSEESPRSGLPAAASHRAAAPKRHGGPSKRLGPLVLEIVALVLLPVSMTACVLARVDQTAAVSMVASVASLLLFFASYEWGRPSLRETMPVVVLSALAAAGRIIFAPIPDVKPVSAICIVAGSVFGRQSGFMVGALAALVSNFFFGQGAWTPWQMYAWGFVGWLAGVLAGVGAFKHKPAIYVYGFASGLLYGFILNIWSLLGFYHPETIEQALVIWAAALPLDIVHGVATVGFLAVLWAPWHRKLERLKAVYGLAAPDANTQAHT